MITHEMKVTSVAAVLQIHMLGMYLTFVFCVMFCSHGAGGMFCSRLHAPVACFVRVFDRLSISTLWHVFLVVIVALCDERIGRARSFCHWPHGKGGLGPL